MNDDAADSYVRMGHQLTRLNSFIRHDTRSRIS